MRKAITPVISIIILLLITISLSGMGWTYMSGYYEAMTAKQIKLVEGSAIANEVMILNIGTAEITQQDLTISVNGENMDMSMEPSAIGKGKSAIIRFNLSAADSELNVRVLGPGNAVSYSRSIDVEKSCLEILRSGDYARFDGTYPIDPDGHGGSGPIKAFCDMTTDGGGWTAVAVNGDNAVENCMLMHIGPGAAGCGTVDPSLLQDWVMDGSAQGLIESRQLLFVAYGDSGYSDKGAYFAIDFGSPIPTPDERTGTVMAIPSLSTTYGILKCDSTLHQNGIDRYRSGTHCTGGSNPFPALTIFNEHDSDVSCMSFYEHDGRDGVDDYQDGCGCSDNWGPKEVRGWRAAALIR